MENSKKTLSRFITTIMTICLIFSSLGNYDLIHAAENQWTLEDFTLPVSLRGASVEYIDGNMYVIGGDKGLHSIVNNVHIYNFETKTWTTGSPMSVSRCYAATSVIDGKIYIMGGYTSANSKYITTDDVEIYDIATDTWTIGASLPLLTVHAKSISYNNKIYIFSGFNVVTSENKIHHATIQIYDIQNNTWSSDTSMPFTRTGYTLNLIEDKVYLIGGFNGTSICNENKIYDLVSGTWSDGSKMEHARDVAISTIYNNKIYVFGGNNTKLLNSTEIYDPVTDTWSKGSDLTSGKRSASSFVINNKIFIVGGLTHLSLYTTTNEIDSLQLPPAENRLFAHLYTGEKTQISFTYDLTDNNNLSWKSSDTRVATVDSNGMVSALETGTTYISAYSQNGTYPDYIPVIVTENDTYRIAVHINVGQGLKLYLKGNPNDIKWFSMDPNVATIDSNGKVTGVSKGLTIVKAELNGKEHYIYVRVS